jgi:D-alanine--poly(phosphoribitol) ligase subunit 2
MIDVDRLQEELQQIFQDELFLEVASAQTDLFEEGILDSLTFVELLVKLESAYGVKVSLESLDTDRFRTLERIAEFVRQETAA